MNKIIYTWLYGGVAIGSIAICIIGQNQLPKANAKQLSERQLANNNLILRENDSVIFKSADNSNQNNFKKILVFIGLTATVGGFGWYLSRFRQAATAEVIPSSNSSAILLDRVSPKLRRQLLRLINDPKTANRLLLGIQKEHRNRSPNWLAEKAIYDLRRGR
jgi:hypothetical protein